MRAGGKENEKVKEKDRHKRERGRERGRARERARGRGRGRGRGKEEEERPRKLQKTLWPLSVHSQDRFYASGSIFFALFWLLFLLGGGECAILRLSFARGTILGYSVVVEVNRNTFLFVVVHRDSYGTRRKGILCSRK